MIMVIGAQETKPVKPVVIVNPLPPLFDKGRAGLMDSARTLCILVLFQRSPSVGS